MNAIPTKLAALLTAAVLAGCATWGTKLDEAAAQEGDVAAEADAEKSAIRDTVAAEAEAAAAGADETAVEAEEAAKAAAQAEEAAKAAAQAAAQAEAAAQAAAQAKIDAIAAAVPAICAPAASVGVWHDLGVGLAPWLAGDAPVPAAEAPTRAAGLRRTDGRWLAIIVVQSAPSGSAACAAPSSLHVPTKGSGCLRMRRDMDFDQYMQRQHAVLWQWLRRRNLEGLPRAWVAHREPGALLEAHALIDPMLLEAVTRSNEDFLRAGQPGLDWAQRFATAVRAAAGGEQLCVPPLPFSTTQTEDAPVELAPQPVDVVPVATQVQPPPLPPPPPRRDRQ